LIVPLRRELLEPRHAAVQSSHLVQETEVEARLLRHELGVVLDEQP